MRKIFKISAILAAIIFSTSVMAHEASPGVKIYNEKTTNNGFKEFHVDSSSSKKK